MKMDTLITIGVIIYIIISIRKALSVGKKAPGDARPSGLKQKLKGMADQIKEEIEKANQQMQEPPPHRSSLPYEMEGDGDETNDEDNRLWSLSEEDEEDDESEDVEETPPRIIRQSVFYETEAGSSLPPRSVVEADTDEEEDYRNRHRAVSQPVQPPSTCSRTRTLVKARGKRQLRRAIIWSEILAKPLTLRK